MKIVWGTKRVVIVLEKFAIKIARIRIVPAFKCAVSWLQYGRFWKSMFKYNYEVYGTVHIYLLKGLIENWHEYKIYRETRSSFLVPTYFSLLGLVNIQKRGESFEMEGVNMWLQMLLLSNKEIWDNPHHFAEPANFSKTNGHLQMLDYGSPRCHRVIRKYGEKMHTDFDFSFTKEQMRWE